MPDIPLPKPPKPPGLTKSSGKVGGQQSHNPSVETYSGNPPKGQGANVVNFTSQVGLATSNTSRPKSATTSQAQPPAVVTALHSVAPRATSINSSVKKSQIGPNNPVDQTPTLANNARIMGQTPFNPNQPTPSPEQPPPPSPSPPASTQKSQPKPRPKPAKPKKSILAKLPLLVGGLMILLALVFLGLRFFNQQKSNSPSTVNGNPDSGAAQIQQPLNGAEVTDQSTSQNQPTDMVELEYWGLWEPTEVIQPLIDEFQQQNPGVTIRYIKQSPKNYRERLQTAIASGNGPDLFRFHASWVPMLVDDLEPMPASIMSAGEFQQTFYPVASTQLQFNGQLVGLPLEYDGLVLFYNKDILQAAGESPPKSWAQVRSLATKLTLKEEGKIKRAGIALGAANNVDHFSDILGLLMLQNGAKLSDPASPEVRDALIFYTNFVTVDRVWDESLPSSTIAFARGEVAMILAPSWRAHEIKNINPKLKFATAPVPQVVDDNSVSWASYWAEGVSKQSKNKDIAWKFLKFLISKESEKRFFAEASKIRAFGEPYSRVDLADQLADDPILSALMVDAPSATSWYLNSNTFDNGINDQIIKYYQDAVNAVLSGKEISSVLSTLSQGVQQVLSQYNVLE